MMTQNSSDPAIHACPAVNRGSGLCAISAPGRAAHSTER